MVMASCRDQLVDRLVEQRQVDLAALQQLLGRVRARRRVLRLAVDDAAHVVDPAVGDRPAGSGRTRRRPSAPARPR